MNVNGRLEVGGTFTGTGANHPTISGSGSLVIKQGATATIDSHACGSGSGDFNLSGATLANEGTLTLGASGGGPDGDLLMSNGARVQNSGTLNDDSWSNDVGPCNYPPSSFANAGGAYGIVNDGAFDIEVGNANTTQIGVPFSNQGIVNVKSGTLKLIDGGVPGEAAGGSWETQPGAGTWLAGGTFLFEEGVGVVGRSEGATILWASPHPRGWIEAGRYVSGTAIVSGWAEGGSAGALEGVNIEVRPTGATEWKTLCASLPPELSGAFSCSWNTASGSYPDGSYELRAKLVGGFSEPAFTAPVTALVDNTPPTGSLALPQGHYTYLSGEPTITGTASDSGAGVGSWQLQIARQGTGEWKSACPEQTTPMSGETYGCTLETAKYGVAFYQLRVLVTDRAGNTYATPSVDVGFNKVALTGTLASVAPYIATNEELSGTATSSGPAVESWVVQITLAGSDSWSDACPAQTTPVHGSEYRCEFEVSALASGEYELRALVTDMEGDTYATAAQATALDRTPPAGSLDALPEAISGDYEVQGLAFDSGSGVASWELEVAPAGSESFSEACPTQTLPLSGIGNNYGCTVTTTALANGRYQFRARITNNLGLTFTTPIVASTVDNVGPASVKVPTITGETVTGRTLSASSGTWSGGGPISYAYQWQRCNSSGEACANVEGATSALYTLGSADTGDTLRVVVTATNSAGSASASSAVTATVSGNALTNVSLPTISGTSTEGATLDANPGTWHGAQPIAYTYQWERCNAAGESCAAITGATAQSYTLGEADVSSTLRVTVTATNSEGTQSEPSAVTAKVAASSATGIRYLYDESGQLSVVDDPSQGAAVYSYDADGNITQIKRYSDSTVSVLAFAPKEGPPGTVVDITGTGFSREPSKDEVSFNGKAATVAKASTTDIIATVPEGAGVSPITVKVEGHSATSSESFDDPPLVPLASSSLRLPLGGAGTTRKKASRSVVHASALGRAKADEHPTPAVAPPPHGSTHGLPASLASYRSPYPARWIPTARNHHGNWSTGRVPSPWASLPALAGPRKATGISGQALEVDGTPLAGVTLSIQGTGQRTRTDSTGRFLLDGIPAGHQVLVIEGKSADSTGLRYGRFTVAVEVRQGKITPLGYTIWMTPLDPAGNTTIESPLKRETTITNPNIPGLEVRLPAGTVIHSASGAVVHHLNLTAIPTDRSPFPLPLFGGDVPTYFTIQPGGAYLNKGAQIIYPNWEHEPPGQRVEFWNYDATNQGWYIYGHGTVSANGQQVIPDPDVRIWEFSGAMQTGNHEPGHPGCPGCAPSGDPVDPASGLFQYTHTDLKLEDSLMPLTLSRTYRPADNNSYGFGIGTESSYELHLWSNENYRTSHLVLPEGNAIKFVRTSPGGGYTEAVYEAVETGGEWEGAVLQWNVPGHDWLLRRRDGMKFYFPEYDPVSAIEDPNGNRITIVREGEGPPIEASGPHGQWIRFSHDAYGRITEASDNAGQHVRYEYDSAGRLATVVDPMGNVTHYAYNAENDMTRVTDARGNVLIENGYGANGRVLTQTLGGSGTYTFAQLPCTGCEEGKGGAVVTNPDGRKRYVYFDHWRPTSEVINPGPAEEWGNYQYNSNGNITKITSNRGDSSFTYDSVGDLTSSTQESSTLAPLTTRYTYNEFAEPTSVTGPLGETTSYGYEANGNLTTILTPMGERTTLGYDSEGEPTALTNAEGDTSTYGYEDGERVSVTDPLGHQWRFGYDALGLPVSVTAPEGHASHIAYNEDDEVVSETNPAGDKTSYGYDSDADLISVTDPDGHTQTGSYNAYDELTSWTDALGHMTSYVYDGAGNLTSVTNPKSETTTYTYDGLNRLTSASFGKVGSGLPTSTTTYSYGPEGNLTSATDSRAGTWTLAYDPYDRLTSEKGPNGTVEYAFNADGERQSMSVNGEEAASYAYDPDGLLTGISTPSGNVSLAYDQAQRRTRVTLPDGDSESYTYNPASQLTGILYKNPAGEALGNLEYGRDALGRVSTVSGSLARTNLPAELAEATYNADDELTELAGQKLTYDADGNLLSSGTSTFAWNDRGQLESLTRGSNSWTYSYDPFGRRTGVTKNSTATTYLYDGQNVLHESSGGETTTLLNGLGRDQRFARTSGHGTSSYLTDQLGSTVALAGASGAPSTEYTYGPFGESTASGGSSNNPYQYTGRANDENGLQYNRARYYSSATDRFISQDPLDELVLPPVPAPATLRSGEMTLGLSAGGRDRYVYTADDPMNAFDRTGLNCGSEEGEEEELRREMQTGSPENPCEPNHPTHVGDCSAGGRPPGGGGPGGGGVGGTGGSGGGAGGGSGAGGAGGSGAGSGESGPGDSIKAQLEFAHCVADMGDITEGLGLAAGG